MALVAEIAGDFKRDAAFPAEALEAARLYTEAYAVELAGAAKSSALRAGRLVVEPRDLELARALRGERV